MYNKMLEYWMQNGKAALLLKRHDITRPVTITLIRLLLEPLFQASGKGSKLAVSLFYSIYNTVSKSKNKRNALAAQLHGSITKRSSQNKSCTYCGETGANEMASYVFPFITTIGKFPNAYSWGKIRSLNFCPRCMLIALAANSRLLFNVQSPTSKEDFISAAMFFSKDENDLARFYNGFINPILVSGFRGNINLFRRQPRGTWGYDRIWYSEEFLVVLIDYISLHIGRQSRIKKSLGALIFSYSRASATNIYDSFEVIDSIHPFVAAMKELNNKDRDAFKKLFRTLRTSGKNPRHAGDFTDRRKFLRKLLIYKKLDWKIIENIVMYYASDGKPAYHLNSFIWVMIKHLHMTDEIKDVFHNAKTLGSQCGINMKKKKVNPNAAKSFIYKFRSTRNFADFLCILNIVQAQTGILVKEERLEAFTERKNFQQAKCSFLVGYSNAIFGKN